MINSRTNQGTSEGSETSTQEGSTRRIRFCREYFFGTLFSHVLKNRRPKIDHTKNSQQIWILLAESFPTVVSDLSQPFCFVRALIFVCVSLITNSAVLAGLPISWTLGRRHNFCCRGSISNPRPFLDSSAQTTRGMLLDFFCKPQNGIFAFFCQCFLSSRKKWFPGGFRHCIGPLSSNTIFSESELVYERKASCDYRISIIKGYIDRYVLKYRWYI